MPEAEAAVAIVHAPRSREDGADGLEESVLLIRRTERESDPWSGHWSFPGGRRDPQDEDLVETALRELAEECGIVLGRERLERCLPLTAAGRRVGRVMTVAPFLFRAPGELPTALDPEEAAQALWLPVAWFRDPARHSLTAVPRLPAERIFPAIELNGVPLWGFTYRVLTEWLGIHEACDSAEKPGFRAACFLLDFLLANGLELGHTWREGIAAVRGKIPVDRVFERLAVPAGEIPGVNSVEVRPDAIRVLGLDLEEYVIEAVSEREGLMKKASDFVATAEREDFFEMANLSPKRTGLPFVVWISPKGGASHDVRVKVSPGSKVQSSEIVSVAIRPEVRVVGGSMSAHDLALLKKWVELNQDVLIKYWDGEIEYAEDAIGALKSIEE